MNRAAFARADAADAKRGFPAFDLRAYAQQRGLDFLDHATLSGFRGALPCDASLQHNVVKGTLPGGAHGMLAHAALQVPITSSGNATWSSSFWSVKTASKGTFGDFLLNHFVPDGINDLFHSEHYGEFDPINVPCTVAATRVGETATVQPYLRIDRVRKAPPYDYGNRVGLEGLGLKGWNLQSSPAWDAGFLSELLAEPVASLLRSHSGDGLFQIVVEGGLLVVRRNGFLSDAAELDELAEAASLIGARLRSVSLARLEPKPFDTELPSPTWLSIGETPPRPFNPGPMWMAWASEQARTYGLTIEDQVAYHRAFPSQPVPGIAQLVFRGVLPTVQVDGRLVVHAEDGCMRAAVLFPAPPGIPDTPPGGLSLMDRGVYFSVQDGVVAIWMLQSYSDASMANDLPAFLTTALDVGNERLAGAAAA